MEHKPEHDLSHRQEREQKKHAHAHSTPPKPLSSVHPAWYVIVAVAAIGLAIFVWMFLIV